MPGDAAGEAVAGVEERGVGVGELLAEGEQVEAPLRPSAGTPCTSSSSSTARRVQTAHWPRRPPDEADRARPRAEVEVGEQVGHDRVVVAGVERDLARRGRSSARARATSSVW